jgi:Kdo2-lipid IVA lauroyltransferase/acyltransferase
MARRPDWQRQITRYVVRPFEAAALHFLLVILRALPLDAASALGGAIGRAIGPRLGLTRRARRNLEHAFPEMDAAAREATVREMWDNLGRIAAELPHLTRIKVFGDDPIAGKSRVEIVGLEWLDAARDAGKPVICFTAHIGNWEVAPLVTKRRGMPLQIVYRSANNKWADRLFLTGRRDVVGGLIPKGAEGARLMIRALHAGQALGMLVDQKMNDGIAVPFLGRDAMTAPAIAQLALKFDCIVQPLWMERIGGAHYRIHFEKPLARPNTGDRHADIRTLMTAVNAQMEQWIRKRPGQWLWLHRRWSD